MSLFYGDTYGSAASASKGEMRQRSTLSLRSRFDCRMNWCVSEW